MQVPIIFFTNLPMGTFVLQFWSSLAERLMLRLTSPRLGKTAKAGRDTARTSDQRNSWCLGVAAQVVRAQPHCSGLGPRDLNCQDCYCCLGCNCAYKHCTTSETEILKSHCSTQTPPVHVPRFLYLCKI